MAILQTILSVPAVKQLLGWIDTKRRERRAKRTQDQLNALPDYMLHDIGVTRSDIDRVADIVRNTPLTSRGITLKALRLW